MIFEKSAYWVFILVILFFAYLSVNMVFDGAFLVMKDAVEQDETGIGKDLLGSFLEGYDKISLDILPRD